MTHMSGAISVNRSAQPIVETIVRHSNELGVLVEKTPQGTTVIDAGLRGRGGYSAGRLITEVCLGGNGVTSLTNLTCGDLELPAISVSTDQPAIALFGSQYAGWQIKLGKYFAMASGPARALALKPKEIYDKIGYKDESDFALVVLETTEVPPPDVLSLLAKACKVTFEKLYVIVVPITSIAGSIQVSGRVVEVGLHKLTDVGFNPRNVVSGFGVAPISPVHSRQDKAMGRANDMILYGGRVYLSVLADDDRELRTIVEEVPSCTSKDYGRPFSEIFEEVNYDFYKVDPGLFAPASITVNNLVTGSTFSAGLINAEALKQSIRS